MFNEIRMLFDQLHEMVYIIDPRDHSLVYMNRHALRVLGFENEAEVIGRGCLDVLPDGEPSCSFCRCSELDAGEYYECSYYNSILKRPLARKETIIEQDGNRFLLVIELDLDAQERGKNVVSSLCLTEAKINEALSEALREEDPSNAINVFLRELGQKTGSERVYIFEQGEGDYVVNTFEWCADGVQPQIANLQAVPLEALHTWYHYFRHNRNIIISDVDAIRESEPMVYEYLEPQDIHSLVVSPLIIDNQIMGFYGTDNPPPDVMANVSQLAWIVGHFIVSLLKKRTLIHHLAEIGFIEQLTGLQNRRSMDSYIKKHPTAERFGVIYCDVMGLKRVNDSQGHRAGDDLLLRATECLKSSFDEKELYRIGGDEFLVMCQGIEQEDFNSRIVALREAMAENDAMMALGHNWREHTDDLEKMVIEADRLMYAEKQTYYAAAAKVGLLRRRRDDRG